MEPEKVAPITPQAPVVTYKEWRKFLSQIRRRNIKIKISLKKAPKKAWKPNYHLRGYNSLEDLLKKINKNDTVIVIGDELGRIRILVFKDDVNEALEMLEKKGTLTIDDLFLLRRSFRVDLIAIKPTKPAPPPQNDNNPDPILEIARKFIKDKKQ